LIVLIDRLCYSSQSILKGAGYEYWSTDRPKTHLAPIRQSADDAAAPLVESGFLTRAIDSVFHLRDAPIYLSCMEAFEMDLRGTWNRSLLVVGALTLAGCGSGSSSADTEATAGSVVAQPAAGKGSNRSASASGASAERSGPPQVVLQTSAGKITVELDPQASPLTVENFLQYVEGGHYDHTIFHQVVDGYVLVGGSHDNHLHEKPANSTIRNEAHNGLSNLRGTISMARSAETIDSSTCQFFINLADNSKQLDHKGTEPEQYGYCVFGRIVEGLTVCDKIAKAAVHNQDAFEMLPVETVLIESARRVR